MKIQLKNILLILLLISTTFSFAQRDSISVRIAHQDTLKNTIDTIQVSKYNRWSIYGYGGLTQLYGDVVPHYSYSPLFMRDGIISLNGFVGFSRQLTRLFSIDGRFEVANLVSERPYSNIYSKSNMFYYCVGTTFSFSNWFWPNVKNRKWNSYLILSTGFTHYRSASFDTRTDEIIDYYGYTKENDKLVKDKREIVPSAAIGIGLKYRLTNRLDIGFEFIETSVYNDRLDAYVRVLSEKDKFGHTSFGLIYRFENHKKSLVWDFMDDQYLVDLIVKNQLCDCPIISQTVTVLDSLTQTVITNNNRTDSIYLILEKERGPDLDNDKVPDYRDDELTTPLGVVVDSKGVTVKIPNMVDKTKGDSLIKTISPDNNALQSYYSELTIKVDSFFRFIQKERGPDLDNDKIPDYRDEELNTPVGAFVDHRGITIIIPNRILTSNNKPLDSLNQGVSPANEELLSYYNQLTFKVDSFFQFMNKERGADLDNDRIPDYRDSELNTKPGVLVDSKGVTIKTNTTVPIKPNLNSNKTDTLYTENPYLAGAYDSLVVVVADLRARIDSLEKYRYNWINKIEKVDYTIPKNTTIPKTNPNIIVCKGIILDEDNKPISATIIIFDKSNNKKLDSLKSDIQTGRYSIPLIIGKNYTVTYSAEGFGFYTEDILLKDTANFEPVEKEVSLIKLEVGKKFVLRNIFFDFDKSTLRPQSNIELNNLYNTMMANPTLKIEISGHTDNVGSIAYNKVLSMNRAKAVVDYLIKRGISKNRLVFAGYGFDEPIAPNETDEGRQLNRRTEFKIIGI